MLGVLISCKLEESYVAAEIIEGVIGLGVSETKLEIWDTWKAPGGPVSGRELRRHPKLEDFRLALKLVTVFALVSEQETRDVHLATIIVLTNALGEKVAGLRNLENLVRGLGFGLLLVP